MTKFKKPIHGRWETLRWWVDVAFDLFSLTPSERLVVLIVWHHASPDGNAEVSNAELVAETGLSKRAIQLVLNSLAKKCEGKKAFQIIRKGTPENGTKKIRIGVVKAGWKSPKNAPSEGEK